MPKGGDLIGGNASDSRHNPNKQKDQMRSYAQILKSDQTRDTFGLKSFTSVELGQLTEGGQLFVQARDKHSVVVSTEQFTALQVNFKDLATVLRTQFPDALGLRIRNVSQTSKYFEINFRTDAAREAALKKDFSYEGKKVIVSRTFPKDTTIVRVSVSNLPYEDEAYLQEQMSKIFAAYGEILEMGLLHTVHGHFFTGRGVATLNLLPGKQYATLGPQIGSWEAGETLKITFTGMKPTCSRCHVTDHVFGNCPVMRQRLKCCYICQKSDHLQAKCPDAFWNQRKKAAKLNSTHTSAHQQKPVAKAAALTNIIPAEANENNVDTAKEATAFITGIIPAATASMPTTQTSAKEASASTSVTTVEGKEVIVHDETPRDTGAEQPIEPAPEGTPMQQQSQEEVQSEPLVISDEDMIASDEEGDDFEDDDIDLDMVEAEKEAAASSKPLADVVQAMKRQERLRRRKAKAKQMLNDKDKTTIRSRPGGTPSKKKAATKPSSRQ
ncbi:hypothetical protein PS15p_200497 [Mucor circinelloides]